MWMYRTARERRALLFALTAAGPPGMSLCGLSLATDLPEPALQTLLVDLKANGQVRQLSAWGVARYQHTVVASLPGSPPGDRAATRRSMPCATVGTISHRSSARSRSGAVSNGPG